MLPCAYCTALEACNADYDACERYSGYGNPFGDCEDYDPVAADACLAGDMVCTDTPYFSNPIPPSICADVCR
jgi:hypothetical protein